MKKIIFITAIVVLVPAIVWMVLGTRREEKTAPQQTTVVSGGFQKDYSSLNKLFPGKSTKEDAIKLNGQPLSAKTKENKTFLYYPTPSESYKNIVMPAG